MSDTRLIQAEEFVRKVVRLFTPQPSEEQIMQAARKAARALPPFTPFNHKTDRGE